MSNATCLEEPKQQGVPAAQPAVPPAAPDACTVVDYDWRTPRRFTPAERRRLGDFAAKAAQRTAAEVGNLLRRQLLLEVGAVTELYGAALWNPAERPEYGVQLTDKAGRACGMLTMPPQAAIGWTEQLLGGSAAPEVSLKPLSSLESMLLLDIAATFAKAFSATLQELGGPALQHVESVTHEKSPIEGHDKEEFCRVVLVTEIDKKRMEIGLSLLGDLLAPVADPGLQKKKPRPPEELRKELLGHLAATPVKITALLGRAAVTMRDITVLDPGDVLLLSRTLKDPIELSVMGNIVQMGYPVACDGRYAVQVVERREWPRAKLAGKEESQ
jgi:flagellar motor switch protein FliM